MDDINLFCTKCFFVMATHPWRPNKGAKCPRCYARMTTNPAKRGNGHA